jgi:hypothetical protein
MIVKLDEFVSAYLACALWSSTDDVGEPMDDGRDISDISEETVAKAIEDCTAFRESAGDMLTEWSDEQAGHDFWLTRNGHGAGFWDRGLKFGDELSDLARPFGEVYLYVGDDGKVYS